MKRRFEVIVRLKEDLLDPQGKTVEDALPRMGWNNVSEVRVGKYIQLVVDSETQEEALAQTEELAGKLLANPVIEEVMIRALEEAT